MNTVHTVTTPENERIDLGSQDVWVITTDAAALLLNIPTDDPTKLKVIQWLTKLPCASFVPYGPAQA